MNSTREDTVTYRRSELYEEVWKEPVRTVAKRYGVSDVALGKICRKLKVPLPGMGYWACIRAGQNVPRPQLPELPAGARTEISHERWRPRESPPATQPAEPAEPAIVVPETLHNPHKLVSATSRVFRGVRSPTDRCLDISVSKGSRSRALRIMNAILRALDKRGFQVEVTRSLTWQEREQGQRNGEELFDNATRVHVDGEWVCFGITEKYRVVHTPPPDPPKFLRGAEREDWISRNSKPIRGLEPNGVLELSIKHWTWPKVRSTWQDGKHKRVEGSLSDFIAHLYLTAASIKQRRADQERERIERAEAERRRWEEEKRRREEEEREKAFEEKLECWRLARDAREYVREARALVAAANRIIEEGSSLDKSLKWAETYAERVDPLAGLGREVAGNEKKDPPVNVGDADAERDAN
jgi:hypothetical protein